MVLIIEWIDFSNELSNLIKKGIIISEQKDFQDSFINQETKVLQWQSELLDLFYNSFDEKENEFTYEIKNAFKEKDNGFHINTFNQNNRFNERKETDTKTKISDLYKNLDGLIRTLEFYLKFLSSADAIIYPEKLKINDRSDYKTEDILNLILEKLYILYDTNYISINSILESNGIKLGRFGEERELTKVLENRGLVNVMSARNVSAQLTLEGKLYIEKLQKSVKINYEKINENNVEFDKTIDEILTKLEKLGYGQQIIFDEIEELKDLHSNLNKKNFGQILKGKLLDLALAKLIENDTISFIYKTITDEQIHLK